MEEQDSLQLPEETVEDLEVSDDEAVDVEGGAVDPNENNSDKIRRVW